MLGFSNLLDVGPTQQFCRRFVELFAAADFFEARHQAVHAADRARRQRVRHVARVRRVRIPRIAHKSAEQDLGQFRAVVHGGFVLRPQQRKEIQHRLAGRVIAEPTIAADNLQVLVEGLAVL